MSDEPFPRRWPAPREPDAPTPAPPPPPAETGPNRPATDGSRPPLDGTPPDWVSAPPHRRSRLVRRSALVGVLLAATFAAGVTAGIAADRSAILGGPAAAAAQPIVDAKDFALVEEAWNLLHTRYVDAAHLDSKQLAYGAIEGLTQAVGDTGHTSFLTPAEREAAAAALSGSYAGIGAELDVSGGRPVLVGIVPGGPAEAAGLRVGDQILAVDGKPVGNEPVDLVAASIRGPAGTVVTLTIERAGSPRPVTVRIVRAQVTLRPVSWARVPGTSIVDLRVEQLSHGASDAFAAALREALATDPNRLILDLRGDPGGYVNEAVGIASQFLTTGTVYISRDASGVETPVPVRPGALAPSIPLVVLVDHGTASAAEIVAGALQDAGRATVVGTTTFGTGTVLTEYPLGDGSELRIGTAEWLTPKGHLIWHHGITPDQVVDLPAGARPIVPSELSTLAPGAVAASTDTQLRRAIADLTPGG